MSQISEKTFVPKLEQQTGGMNLLEYFAGQALIGLVGVNDKNPTDGRCKEIAKAAVQISKALIVQLEAHQTPQP